MQRCKGNTTLHKMNSVEKELHGYINGTERMSGFDDYSEGNMNYFDDGDYDSFDGDSFDYAGGAPAAAPALFLLVRLPVILVFSLPFILLFI